MNDDFYNQSALQERVNTLREQGYRGYRVTSGKGKVEGAVQVSAVGKSGVTLSASGDTVDEAYENLIEKIDITLDA
ncbi:MAG: hypothetical protein EA391_03355 [Balneolaceae bacterium]|nr:MAG: hypothetical protein EA391_03355 [Balneolaceae bacterium]